MSIRIRKGDTVQVIAGDDRGRVGKVLSVDEEKQRVVIEKVNFVKRHTKARKQGMKSGIVEREAPIHLSNVLLYDERLQRGTRVGIRALPDGKRERVSRASGETIAKSE
jgi:large subunit ribosomal protein L24